MTNTDYYYYLINSNNDWYLAYHVKFNSVGGINAELLTPAIKINGIWQPIDTADIYPHADFIGSACFLKLLQPVHKGNNLTQNSSSISGPTPSIPSVPPPPSSIDDIDLYDPFGFYYPTAP